MKKETINRLWKIINFIFFFVVIPLTIILIIIDKKWSLLFILILILLCGPYLAKIFVKFEKYVMED